MVEAEQEKTAVKAAASFSHKVGDIVLHFLPFHFMDSKYPACLQQTSFKAFKFLLPPPL